MENKGKNTMNKTLQNCGKKDGNGRIYLKVKENRLTDYCMLQITNNNKSVMKETVEVVAPARITAENERNLVNIQSLSPKKKKNGFIICFFCLLGK